MITGLFAGLLAAVHLGIGALEPLHRTPRSRWLSAAGGVAVAYVFLHILPELASHRRVFAEELGTSGEMAERLVYAVALAGLAAFYGLERTLEVSRSDPRSGQRGNLREVSAGAFWLHIGSFGIYNVIIGYLLLHREERGLWPLLIYGIAMALHFVTSDFGLREDHEARYDRVARWIIAAAVMGGWLLGVAVTVPEITIALLFAFLAGGIVLNVLKEELPEERESRFLPFLLGAAAYAGLLIVS